MKHRKLHDKAIVAALLLACIPGLAEDMLPEADPIALIAPAPQDASSDDTPDNPASGL